MRAPVEGPELFVVARAPSLTRVVLCVVPPLGNVVVTVLNLVGEGELTVPDPVTLTEDVELWVAVPVGIKVANEFGRVVCPEVNTAHAPARTTINICPHTYRGAKHRARRQGRYRRLRKRHQRENN